MNGKSLKEQSKTKEDIKIQFLSKLYHYVFQDAQMSKLLKTAYLFITLGF